MAANKQDPRYFKYSPFPKRQCLVTGRVDSSGKANCLEASGNDVRLFADAGDPVVATFANGFDPFPVDYAYQWTSSVEPVEWESMTNGTTYLYIDFDPSTETVSYGKTTVMPEDDTIPPAHGADVHWFSPIKYKMYESVGGAWEERIRLYVGEVESDGVSIQSIRTYAYNAFCRVPDFAVTIETTYSKAHNVGSRRIQWHGYFNNITGAGSGLTNGTSGYRIGSGLFNPDQARVSRTECVIDRMSINMRTGNASLYHSTSTQSYFTGATAELYVWRLY